MGNLSNFVVPWMKDVKPYTTDDVNMAWDHPEFRRMFLNENPYLPEIDAKSNVRIGWVKGTDFSKVYGKSLKELKHVQ